MALTDMFLEGQVSTTLGQLANLGIINLHREPPETHSARCTYPIDTADCRRRRSVVVQDLLLSRMMMMLLQLLQESPVDPESTFQRY